MVKKANQKKYKFILSSLLTIENFSNLDEEELDKVASLVMLSKG